MKRYQNYINGEWRDPASGEWFESMNPYTGKVWAEIARSGESDVNAAVDAADAAFDENGPWRAMNATQRGACVRKLGDLFLESAEHLAEVEVRDNGKLMAEMLGQCRYAPQWYQYYGGLADKVEGSVIPTDKADTFNFTMHEPIGVVGMIIPWNSPLLLLAWKLAPALAAGCTVVIKPSEFTSASALEFVELVEKAGIPSGVVNVVTGFGVEAGAVLSSHPKVRKIAFTGSGLTGQKVMESAATNFKKVSLELGGKSPNIIFEDAVIDDAVKGAVSGIFAATGQTCIAGSRLLVQESVHDEVVDKLVALAQTARLGDPGSADTQVGPVTTPAQYEKILSYLDIAKGEGANCILGGGPAAPPTPEAGQWFVEPTIFDGVKNSMRIAQEEVFGPVLSIITFKDEDEAVNIANDVLYGLGSGVWTQNIGRAINMARRIQAGTVWVNTYRAVSFTTPFGGYKMSGLGRENGQDAIYEYLQTKSVWISTGGEVPNPFVMR